MTSKEFETWSQLVKNTEEAVSKALLVYKNTQVEPESKKQTQEIKPSDGSDEQFHFLTPL